jgi:hypothetical protein
MLPQKRENCLNHASEEALKFSSEELNTHEQLTVIRFIIRDS